MRQSHTTHVRPVVWAAGCLLIAACASPVDRAPDERLGVGSTAPSDVWASHGSDSGGTRFSTANQITRANVADLKPAWTYRTGDQIEGRTRFQATPLLIDGVLFISTPFGRVVALDAVQGFERWSFDPGIDVLANGRLSDVVDDVRRVAEATGTEGSGREIVAGLRERIEAARARTSAAPRPRVACIEWLDPLIVAGHWIPDMVDAAGGTDVLGREGEPSRRIAFDELVSAAADVLVLMPCGMDAERAAREFESLDGLERWGDLPAVQRRETYVVDSGSLFSRSGPRLVDGLEVLGQILHSELFPEALPREAAIRVESMVG